MRRTYIIIAAIAAIILILSTIFFALNFFNPQKQTLTVLCATSLQFPLNKVEADFEKANPNIDVQIQGHGTIQVIRHVTELNYKVDVMLVADYSLIPRMMYPTINQETNQRYANYYIRFATNTLVLAYTNNSKYASEVNANNWYSVLSRPGVKIGLANPQLDALGYRALMAVQLSEDYYGEKGLFHNLITANLDPPINSIPDGSNYTITVPDIQQPKGDRLILRASEVDLIALLQTGNLDYCFIYLSNAKQYGLNYVELPDEVNLGSQSYNSNYERIQVVYSHQRFASVTLDRTGEPIYYGLTIPSNAPHPELAEKFIQFLLNGQGKTDFEQDYQPVFSPSFTDNLQAVPASLQSLAVSEP
jgi:molybdate/tungstate transport system substrate-binding protein